MLNQRELDVLEILWKAGVPMIASDISAADKELGLTQSTVTAVLRKLLGSGLLEVSGVTHSGKVLSRLYRPTKESKDAILETLAEVYRSVKSVVSVEEVIAYLKKEETE